MSAYREQMKNEYFKLHPQIQKQFDFSTQNKSEHHSYIFIIQTITPNS